MSAGAWWLAGLAAYALALFVGWAVVSSGARKDREAEE